MKKLLFPLSLSLLISCGGLGGGGGGGGSTNHEGDLYMEVERDNIDSGDLNQVSIDVSNLNSDGAVLKIRTSKSLRYVANTAVRFPDRDEEEAIRPAKDVATDDERFLVFFLYPRDAIDGDYISLRFNLKATSGDEDAFIELDLDNNDTNITDAKEFSAENPRFSARERRGVYIAPGIAEDPTPTPAAETTGTPTSTTTPAAS